MKRANSWLVTIVGPTAAGKTNLAIELARYLDTVIISADSRQFYKEMTIGTDKPSEAQQALTPHYFVNSHSIYDEVSASRYADESLALLKDLLKDHQAVVCVGGSGLYLKALLEGFDPIPDLDPGIRESWNQFLQNEGSEALANALKEKDHQAYRVIDTNNPKRVIRALEIKEGTGHSITAYWQAQKASEPRFFNTLKAGIYLPRYVLYQKIEERCDEMLKNGLLEEVRTLFPYRHLNPLNSVGYKEFFGYLEGKYEYKEAIRRFKAHSRQLAKRQLTWFRRDPAIKWFQPSEKEALKDWLSDMMRNEEGS